MFLPHFELVSLNKLLAPLKVVLGVRAASENHEKLLSLQIGSNLADFWNFHFLIGLVSDLEIKI